MEYIVFGCGSPLWITACSPEQAEMFVVDRYGVPIENLVTMRADDVMLSRTSDCGYSAWT